MDKADEELREPLSKLDEDKDETPADDDDPFPFDDEYDDTEADWDCR